MKSKVVIALLFLGLIGLHAVRAGDDEGGEEAAAAPAAATPKGAAAKKLPPGDFNPEGLPAVPVQPLSVDAAALADDDTLFAKFEPKTVTGKETVAELTGALTKANGFLRKMRRDLEGEKVWTKNVYDIIQNYQYKYLKTIKDVRVREKKVKKLAKLVQLIKQSALHAGVKRELARASEALEELVSRAPAGKGGRMYRRIARKMFKLKKALALMPRAEHLFTDTSDQVKKILQSDVAPESADAIRELVAKPKKKQAPAPKPKPAAKAAGAAAKKGKGKGKGKKGAAKAGKGKKAGGKKGKKAAKKGKKGKKAKKAKKPKKKSADE